MIHTKVRNRLKNKTVYKLLYCYVNLRLLQKINDDDTMTNFLEQAIFEHMGDDEDEAAGAPPAAATGSAAGAPSALTMSPLTGDW
jgi:hypothetical protein